MEMARAYAAIGQKAKAIDLLNQLWKKSAQYMGWYCSLEGGRFNSSQRECMYNMYLMEQEMQLASSIDEKIANKMEAQLQQIMGLYQSKGGNLGF